MYTCTWKIVKQGVHENKLMNKLNLKQKMYRFVFNKLIKTMSISKEMAKQEIDF